MFFSVDRLFRFCSKQLLAQEEKDDRDQDDGGADDDEQKGIVALRHGIADDDGQLGNVDPFLIRLFDFKVLAVSAGERHRLDFGRRCVQRSFVGLGKGCSVFADIHGIGADIPVVSAVGHEIDFTIADFAADMRAPTPSAAAELAVPQREALLWEIGKLSDRLRRAGEAGIAEKAARLSDIRQRLGEQSPENRFRVIGERVRALDDRVTLLCERRLMTAAHRLDAATVRLNAAGPRATLNRGYAVIRQGDRTVPGIGRFDAQRPFTVVMRDGQIDAAATGVRREEQP
jgi:exonuclease VII large subunit